MPVIREDPWVVFHRNKWNAIDKLALESGFDQAALEATEACLLTFFDRITEECAKVAETQSRTHSDAAGAGACLAAAEAIRNYGRMLGNES